MNIVPILRITRLTLRSNMFVKVDIYQVHTLHVVLGFQAQKPKRRKTMKIFALSLAFLITG